MKKYILIFMMSFLSNLCGCGEDIENSDFQNLEQPAIYGNLNTYRTDTYQKRMALDPVDDPLKWQNIALSRSITEINVTCIGGLSASGGSGFLIGKGTIVGAKHTIDQCPDNFIQVKFAKDRESSLYNSIDNIAPNLWLLNNRIHQLSIESNFSNENKEIFYNKFVYEGVIIDPIFNDKDIVYLKISPKIIKVLEKFISLDAYVFFDYLNLPKQKEHNLQLLENTQLWAFSVTHDPAKKYEGNWRIFNFDPYLLNNNEILNPTTLISDPGYLKTFDPAEFGQPCSSNAADKYCFKTSLDAIPRQSGGAVIHRINNSSEYYVVGVIRSTKGTANDTWESTFIENENTNNPSMIWTKAVLIDDIIAKPPVVSLPGEPNPHTEKPKPEGEEETCIGCDNGLIDTKIYSCYEALGENLPGIVVGFVGSPQGTNGRPSQELNINSIGTLGIVCNQWRHTPYTERWGDLKVYGYTKTLDTIQGVGPGDFKKNIVSYLQQAYINFYNPNYPQLLNSNPNQHLLRNPRPAPAKFCPPSTVVTGIQVGFDTDNKFIKGLNKIYCRQSVAPYHEHTVDLSVSSSFPLANNTYKQYIGVQNQGSPRDLKCSSNKVMTGIKIKKHPTSSFDFLQILCKDSYFQP